jgi:hypothetical protein
MIQVPAPLPIRTLHRNVGDGRLCIFAHDLFGPERQREFRFRIRFASVQRPEASRPISRNARTSSTNACNGDDLIDEARTGSEQRFKPSSKPTCHSPPDA